MKKTIDITTTQNVTIEYQYALLRERMLAWMLDTVIVGLGYLVVLRLFVAILGTSTDSGMSWGVMFALLPFLCFFCYNFLFEIINSGQTPGKMATGIKVVRLDGKDPDWSDTLLRALLHLVDSIFSSGVVGSVLIKTTPNCQRFGDMAANTTVIKISNQGTRFRLNDILSISSLDTYQPQYPQVRRLNEADMIFIKNALIRFQKYPNTAHEHVIEDLVSHLMPILEIEQRPFNRVEFLKTLLRDYVVLTR